MCYQLRHDLTELAFAAGAVLDGASVETEAQRLRLNELAAVLDAIDWPTEPAQNDGSVRHG